MTPNDLSALTDEQLVASLHDLVARNSRLTATVVLHLAEVEARKLHLAAACSSMFDYCVRVLRLDEAAAYNRIQVARLVGRFPLVLDMLQDGRLHLTGARLLGPHLTEDSHRELLEAAQNKSKRAIEKLIAERHPKPDAPDLIRKLPSQTKDTATQLDLQPPSTPTEPPKTSRPDPPKTPRPKESTQPTAPDRYKVQFTASAALVAKLDEVKALLSHREPSPDLAIVVERAVDLLRADLLKERFGVGAKPRASTKPGDRPRTRHVPRSVRREVVLRDGLRCAFVDPKTGRRCAETKRLELQHHLPFAWGGQHDADSISVFCKAHNRYAAERDFGRQHIDRAIEARRRSVAAGEASA